jgi:hypothetical protein
MELRAILRNAGATIVQAPLLWFFATLVFLTWDLPSYVPGLEGFTLILFPIIVLAEAGEIRSVQLHNEGTLASVSQVIRQVARKLGSLIAVFLISVLLMLLIAGILVVVARILLQHVLGPEMILPLYTIDAAIAYPFFVFAQCALVISDLPLRSSLTMAFRVLRKDAFTILVMMILFVVLHYFMSNAYSTIASNAVGIAGYMLALLIVEGTQSTAFTFAYIYYVRETHV